MKYILFMPKKFRQLIINKTTFVSLTLLLITVGVFFVFQGANASDFFSAVFAGVTDPIGFLGKLLLGLFLIIIQFLGVLFVFFVGIMIDIAQFNTFINMPMVVTGWGLARDVANMFFIVVLLIIAFSTVLKISSYHYQKTLTKLLIMAILVNFSKLIAGFLIDFFQVVMLTFVNGFKDVAGGNLAQGFGIYEMLSQAPGITDSSSLQGGFVVAGALAVVMILVADMVILVMIAVLLWRIAMLWVLVIISPLAYLSYAFMPKYWSQWWQMFFQHLISGPVIAFFLWLALLTMQQGEVANQFSSKGTGELQSEMSRIIPSNVDQSVLLNYMVVMALLLGGLAISQKVAAQSGGAVGNFAQRVQKVGNKAALIGTGVAAAGWALKKAPGYLNERQAAITGISLNYKDWKQSYDTSRTRTKRKRMSKALGNIDEITERGIANTVMDRVFLRRTRSGWAARDASDAKKEIEGLEARIATPNLGKQYRRELETNLATNKTELEKINTEQGDFEKTRKEEWDKIYQENQNQGDWDERKAKTAFDSETDNQSRERLDRRNLLSEENKEIETLLSEDDETLAKRKQTEIRENITELEKELKVKINAKAPEAEIDKIRDQIAGLEANLQLKPLSSEDIATMREKIDELRSYSLQQDMKKTKLMPETGYWRAARARETAAEEYKKVQFEENSDVLVESLKKAVLDKDRPRIEAITMKLAKDGNFNEALLSYGYGDGKDGMGSTKKFFEEIVKGKAGFSDQDMHRLASDVSYNCESVNHWNQARINTKENGKYKWFSEAEHSLAAVTEMEKKHQQMQARSFGRLAVGGEEYNPKTGKMEYGLSPLGAMYYKRNGMDLFANDPKNIQTSTIVNLYKSEIERNELSQMEMRGLLPNGFVDKLKELVKTRKLDKLDDTVKASVEDYERAVSEMNNMRNIS